MTLKFTDTQLLDIKAAAVEAVADIMHATAKPTYPKDHVAGMAVPKGGSNCAKCEYLADNKKDCTNEYFQKWNGGPEIPGKIDEYCSDWFQVSKKISASTENSFAGDQKGSLWNGIKLIGFTGPEEEGLRALLSRVPPELYFNVKEFVSSPELNAKHGQFVPETKTIRFNPTDFHMRQRLGVGPGWMLHQEVTAVHEIGHSIYEALTPEKQKEWESLSGWQKGGSKLGQAPPYEELRPGWPHLISEWTHTPGVYMPRHYSEKNPNEQFADCFAYVILGKGHMMGKPLKKFVDDLIKDNVKKYPSASIESPTRPYLERDAIRHSRSV